VLRAAFNLRSECHLLPQITLSPVGISGKRWLSVLRNVDKCEFIEQEWGTSLGNPHAPLWFFVGLEPAISENKEDEKCAVCKFTCNY
jgi:hypothetical protein